MATLMIETYQLCWGDGVADPLLVAEGLRDKQTAERLRLRFDELLVGGQLDPTVYVPGVGVTFYVRATPGTQEVTITATDLEGIMAELNAPETTLPLYVKVTGAENIRVLELSFAKIVRILAGAEV